MLKYNTLLTGWKVIFSSLIFTEIYLVFKDINQCGNISMTCIHYWLLPAEFYLVAAVMGVWLCYKVTNEPKDESRKQTTG